MNAINIYIRNDLFQGFYNSCFESLIDNALETLLSDLRGYPYEKLKDRLWECDVDYKTIHKSIAREFISHLNFNLHIDYEFEVKYLKLSSPKFYNYRSDWILVELDKKNSYQFLRLAYKHRTKFLEYLRTESPIYYSKDRSFKRGYLKWFIKNDLQDDFLLYLVKEANCLESINDYTYENIFEIATETALEDPKYQRLTKIAGYLITREQREEAR